MVDLLFLVQCNYFLFYKLWMYLGILLCSLDILYKWYAHFLFGLIIKIQHFFSINLLLNNFYLFLLILSRLFPLILHIFCHLFSYFFVLSCFQNVFFLLILNVLILFSFFFFAYFKFSASFLSLFSFLFYFDFSNSLISFLSFLLILNLMINFFSLSLSPFFCIFWI